MSLDKMNLSIDQSTISSGIKLGAGLLSPVTGTAVEGIAEIMDADVKRADVLNTFKRQVAGMLGVQPSEVNDELIERHRSKLPEWFIKEWDDANDIAGKTSNFFVSMVGAAGCGLLGSFLIPVPFLGAAIGMGIGFFATDMIVKEYRNARGDVGGVSTTNLAKALREMAEEHKVDSTLVATMMLISKRPEENTEELDAMVQKHLEEKQQNSKGVTELESYIHMQQGYLVTLLGADVQSKYASGTQVQDIVAGFVQSKEHVDALMWKPDEFYNAVSQQVSLQYIERQRKIAEQHHMAADAGKAILNSDGKIAHHPPARQTPEHEMGRGG